MTRTSIALAASIAAASLLATPALAGEGQEKSVTVSYSDLNLNSRDGVDRLLRRIERAAETACDVQSGRRDLRTWNEERACLAETMSAAVQDVGVASVTTAYAARHGDAAPARIASAGAIEG